MKRIIFFILIAIGTTTFSQSIINMQNGNISVDCSTGAILYDNGGSGSNYSNNQDLILTLCPASTGAYITINFSSFDVESGYDYLEIYNGSSTTSPLIQSYDNTNTPGTSTIQSSDASGCLTLYFHSDGSVTGNFEATIGCYTSCQQIFAEYTSSPIATNDYIDACQGQTITLTGIGNYPQNGTAYNQSDATSSFTWTFNDAAQTVLTGQTITYTNNDGAAIDVDLVITDVMGCQSTNDLGLRLRISPSPVFSGTNADNTTLCLGDCANLTGTAQFPEVFALSSISMGGTPIWLPDGSGVSYTSDGYIDAFAPGQTFTGPNDIQQICVDIEHSYVGDLEAWIICPNGQSMELWDTYNGTGSSQYLGNPIDGSTGTPGTGETYCFSPIATNGDLSTAAGATPSSSTITPGTYEISGNWNDLIGCPLNGTWTIQITDHLSIDDGYIFGWGIDFNPAINPNSWSFQNTITTQTWSGDGVSGTNPATACPTALGNQTYTFSVIDDFNCSYDTTININVIGLDVTTSQIDPSCNGNCNGSASITSITGNTGTVSYNWSSNANTANTSTANNLCAGTYTVTITDDGASCTNTQTFTLTDPPALSLNLTSTDATCGNANGSITASTTNGTPNFTYTGIGATNFGPTSNLSSNETFSNLAPGNYNITVTDANGCNATNNITINDAGNVTAIFTPPTNQCLSGNSFTFDASASTVIGTPTYTWDFGDGNTATGITVTHSYATAGTYTVTLSIVSGGCSDTYSANVTVYPQPVASAVVDSNVSCNGLSDGQATASGGGTYLWDSNAGNQTSATATGLAAGTYTVTVTSNVGGCTDETSVTITEPDQLQITVAVNPVQCHGNANGTAQCTITTESTPPYNYNWSNGESTLNTTATSNTVSNFTAGSYTVSVTDNNGCLETANFTISEPPAWNISETISDATCGNNNGSIDISVNGNTSPYNYNWEGPNGYSSVSEDISNVSAGSYSVTISDANACDTIVAYSIIDAGAPVISINAVTEPSCNGGNDAEASAILTTPTVGPYSYSWSPGNTINNTDSTHVEQSGLSAGPVSIQVTDANGCTASANTTINEPAPLTAVIDSVVTATCGLSNGAAFISVSGGTVNGDYSYNWSTSPTQTTQDATNIPAGSYTVSITDDNNCLTTIDNINVGDTPPPVLQTSIISMPLCNGDCNAVAEVSVVSGGTAPFNFTWDNGLPGNSNTFALSDTVSGLCASTYNVTLTDANGCTASAEVKPLDPSPLTISVYHTDVSCNAGNDAYAQVTANGGTPGYYYSWSNGGAVNDSINTNLTAGAYSVTVTDNNGCSIDTSITINEPDALSVSVINYNDETCGNANGTITVSGSGGSSPYSYLWDNNAGNATDSSINNLVGNVTYYVTITDNNGCSAVTNQYLDSIPGAVINISSVQNVSCNGDSNGAVSVNINGGTAPFNYSWSNGVTENNTSSQASSINNLTAGSYSVTVTDANGCSANIDTLVTEPDALSNVFFTDTISCSGDCNGAIKAVVSGGTMPYNYQWDNSSLSTSDSIGNLCAGNYSVTISDANGCELIQSHSLNDPPAMSLSAVTSNSTCSQNNGSIDLSVQNPLNPMSYHWEGPNGYSSNSEDLNNLFAGNYSVTVTNANNCSVFGSWAIDDEGSPVAVISDSSDVSCYGAEDGYITVQVNGGTGQGTYSFLWNTGDNTQSLTNIRGGTYIITVTDANGCQATASATIHEPDQLDFNLQTQNPSCNGYNDGYAIVSPFGGTPPYYYHWTGSGDNPNDSIFSNLADGSYSVIITDNNGCDTVLNNIIISEPPLISASSTVNNVSCFGGNNGSISLNVIGGTSASGNYSYQWDSNANYQTGQTANNLTAGSYQVSIYDDNNCELVYSQSVNQPDILLIDTLIQSNLSCFQSNDGNIHTHVSGGVPAYTYNWESSNNPGNQYSASSDISGLEADTYFLTVTDANGCNVDTSVIITQPLALTVSLNANDETCFGLCDGYINATVNGGTQIAGSYDFLWSDNSSNQNLNNACPGTYSLTVTDANGCNVNATETINGAPELYISIDDIQNASCGNNNGSIDISIGGGTGVPVINWQQAVNNANTQNQGNTHVIDLPSGNYYVAVTDENSCTVDTTIAVNDIGGPILDSVSVSDVLCFGDQNGSITVYYHQPSPSNPPYTISWSGYPQYDNMDNINNLSSGNYYFQITDGAGCSVSGSAQVGTPSELTSAFNASNDATCNGSCNGSANLNVNGGTPPYSYVWTNNVSNQNYATNLCAGSYQVTVTDYNNCSSISTVNIQEPAPLQITTDYINDVSCNGLADGSVGIIASGGSGNYFYQWTGGISNSSSAGNLSADISYTVSVIDQNDVNCVVSASFMINEPEPIVINTSSNPTTCNNNNGSAEITSISGGNPNYSVQWSPCSVNCNSWAISGLNNSAYQVQVTDANGCSEVAVVNVYAKQPPYLFSSSSHDALCNGSNDGCASIVVKAGERPYIYDWIPNGGTNNDSASCNLSAGTYNVVVTDADGCQVTTVFTIDEPDPVTVFADGPNSPVCINQQTNLTVTANGGTPPYSYQWSDSALTGQVVSVYPEQTSSYTVTATDANGCVSEQAQVLVQTYPAIHVDINPQNASICKGESVALNANASGGKGSGYLYHWYPNEENNNNNNSISVSPDVDTDYFVWAEDLCHSPSDTAVANINIAPTPSIDNVIGAEGCEPLNAIISVSLVDTSMTVMYEWNFGDIGNETSNQPLAQHTYNNDGSYDVTLSVVSVPFGCTLDTVFNSLVNVYPIPEAIITSDKEVTSIFNPIIEFTDNSEGFGYNLSNTWNFGDSSFVSGVNRVEHRFEYPGKYHVTLFVTNQYGCSDSTYKTVEVKQEHTFYMPNAFRPHIDKWFYPKGIGIQSDNYKFTIYDRWGEIIFETTEMPAGTDKVDRLGEIEGGWNGKYFNNGSLVQAGVYIWLVEIEDASGYIHEYSGTVNVIK